MDSNGYSLAKIKEVINKNCHMVIWLDKLVLNHGNCGYMYVTSMCISWI